MTVMRKCIRKTLSNLGISLLAITQIRAQQVVPAAPRALIDVGGICNMARRLF
jgi:hypothetical protein